jgi:hypothetical protein
MGHRSASSNIPNDRQPVGTKIGLAPDQRDLSNPQLGELRDEIEALLGGELIGARVPRARPAVIAAEVTA